MLVALIHLSFLEKKRMKTKWELLDYPTGVFNCSMLFMRMRSPLITDNVHHFIQVSGILFVTLEWKRILPWVAQSV
jgi:hypothetical protein